MLGDHLGYQWAPRLHLVCTLRLYGAVAANGCTDHSLDDIWLNMEQWQNDSGRDNQSTQ
jgi:hypothetical protein